MSIKKIFFIILVIGILCVLGFVYAIFSMQNTGSLVAAAQQYCPQENVAGVEVSEKTGYIKVISSLLGGGATYYAESGDTFSCPVVGPDAMSQECKDILDVQDWSSVCRQNVLSSDAANAVYAIEGETILLVNGRAESEIVPGSASKVVVSMFGSPFYGDLDNDGDQDAVVMLVKDTGGSGAFYYVAAAIQSAPGGFSGTNAVLLGDRIAPQTIQIKQGIIAANYADRKQGEPMTASPSLGVSKYMKVKDGDLIQIPGVPNETKSYAGYIVFGHEVRTFQICGSEIDAWLIGNASGYNTVIDTYQKEMGGKEPYEKLYAHVRGYVTEPPKDGFGSDYSFGFYAEKLLDVDKDKECTYGE